MRALSFMQALSGLAISSKKTQQLAHPVRNRLGKSKQLAALYFLPLEVSWWWECGFCTCKGYHDQLDDRHVSATHWTVTCARRD